jgi:hypothetical protein
MEEEETEDIVLDMVRFWVLGGREVGSGRPSLLAFKISLYNCAASLSYLALIGVLGNIPLELK